VWLHPLPFSGTLKHQTHSDWRSATVSPRPHLLGGARWRHQVPLWTRACFSSAQLSLAGATRTSPLACRMMVPSPTEREIMLFIGKPIGRSIMISNATNPSKDSRKESPLRCAGCTSICVWLVCDLVVMCVQTVGDRALGDLCICVRCGSVQSQKVWVCCNRGRHQCGSC